MLKSISNTILDGETKREMESYIPGAAWYTAQLREIW